MGVRFVQSDKYWTQVRFVLLNEQGKNEEMSFDAQFKRLDREGVADLTSSGAKDADMLRKVLVDWKLKDLDTKEDIAFTDSTFEEFLKIPGAAGVTMLRFLETVGASREKK